MPFNADRSSDHAAGSGAVGDGEKVLLLAPAGPASAPGRVRPMWRGNFLLALGLTISGGSLILAVLGPHVAPYDPYSPVRGAILVPPPSLSEVPGLLAKTVAGVLEHPVHWFGTDASGFDVFSRVLAAMRVDVSIALAAMAVSLTVGTALGLVAGYFRSWLSETLVRLSDVAQAFPVFILAMVLVALAGRNAVNIVIALSVLYTPIYMRLTRSRVLTQRTASYVEAARAIGVAESVIAVRHVLPNSLGPSLVQASVTVGWAILLTAGLSFVGAGVRPPTPEWGLMISTGANSLVLGQWWPSIFPGIAISVTVLGYAIVGDALGRRYG